MARAYGANSNALIPLVSLIWIGISIKVYPHCQKNNQDKRKSITNDLTRRSYDDPVNLLFVLTALLALLSSLEQ